MVISMFPKERISPTLSPLNFSHIDTAIHSMHIIQMLNVPFHIADQVTEASLMNNRPDKVHAILVYETKTTWLRLGKDWCCLAKFKSKKVTIRFDWWWFQTRHKLWSSSGKLWVCITRTLYPNHVHQFWNLLDFERMTNICTIHQK